MHNTNEDHCYTRNEDTRTQRQQATTKVVPRSDHTYTNTPVSAEIVTAASHHTPDTTRPIQTANAREALIMQLRKRVRTLQRKNCLLEQKLGTMTRTLKKFLHQDQIHELQGSRC